MEQFIVILMVLVFSAGDLIVRWWKKRADQSAPPGPRRDESFEVLDEDEVDEPDWFEVLQEQQRRQHEERAERERLEREPTTARGPASREPAQREPASRDAERAPVVLFPPVEVSVPLPPPRPTYQEEATLRPIPVESVEPARGIVRDRARRVAPAPRAEGRLPIRAWVRDPDNARRGIVLMAVLGTCKGME